MSETNYEMYAVRANELFSGWHYPEGSTPLTGPAWAAHGRRSLSVGPAESRQGHVLPALSQLCSISGVIVKVQNQLVLLRLPFSWAVKYMDCPWEWDEQGHRLSLKRAFILLNLSSNTELYRLILPAIILSKLFVKTACRHSYWIIFLNKYHVQF